MSNDNTRSVKDVLKGIENIFQDLVEAEPTSTEDKKIIQNQAKAKTLVYLCLALNPYRTKMVGANSKLLTELGLTPGARNSYDLNNLNCLKELVQILENDPTAQSRCEILSYIADILVGEDWKELKSTHGYVENKRVFNKDIKTILKETYSMSDDEIKSLADICMNGAASGSIPTDQKNGSRVNAPLLVVGLGAIGGYMGGKALVAGLTSAGVIASATVGGAIIAGAVIVAIGVLALLTYGIYNLCNLINNSDVVKNCKSQYSYFKAAKSENDFADTIKVFMNDPRNGGELPNLVK